MFLCIIGECSDHATSQCTFHMYMFKCPLQFKLIVRSDASMGKYGTENVITHFWELLNQSGEQTLFSANHQVLEGLLILIIRFNEPNLF